jgi:hypothetical protein
VASVAREVQETEYHFDLGLAKGNWISLPLPHLKVSFIWLFQNERVKAGYWISYTLHQKVYKPLDLFHIFVVTGRNHNGLHVYSTSQKFGHTYSFQGFSSFLLFSTMYNNSEDMKTMK